MRWTRQRRRFLAPDEALFSYGEVVWSWRRDAGAKLAGGIPPVTVAKKPAHRGEHEVSRKAIAWGKPGCFGWTCMLVCVYYCAFVTPHRRCSGLPAFPATVNRGAR